MLKIVPFVMLFIGEVLYVYLEMRFAHSAKSGMWSWYYFIICVFAAALLGVMILYGYFLGYRVYRNIWMVSVASITSILIAEPLTAWILFREMPSRGAWIGLVLGFTGFVASILF